MTTNIRFVAALIPALFSFSAEAAVFLRGGVATSCTTLSGSGGVSATCLAGQTAIQWTDLATEAAGNAYRYKLYESASPITSGNYGSATLVAQGIPNNSGQVMGDCPDIIRGKPYTQTNRQTTYNSGTCQGEMMPLSLGGPEPPSYSGLWVRTVPTDRTSYYAVVGNNGSDAYIGSVGPLKEVQSAIQPIQIRVSTSRTGDPRHLFSISGGAAGLPLEANLHASSAPGGAAVGHSEVGDYWVVFGDPTMGYQDGIPFVFYLFRTHSRLPGTISFFWRETWWTTQYGNGGVESNHAHIATIPSAQTQAAYGANGSAHMYPFAIKRLKFIFDFIQTRYGPGTATNMATNNWIGYGESMGSWGWAQFGLKEYPGYFAAMFISKGPQFQKYAQTSSATAWCSPNLFGANCPVNNNTATLPDGTAWGGIGGRVDLTSQVANARIDLTPTYWSSGRHDSGFTGWSFSVAGAAAFQSSIQCHAFAWNNMGHSEGGSPLNSLWQEAGRQSGGVTGQSYGYSEFWFKTDQATPCFANSSINDNIGTATATGGEYDGDIVGCLQCGFTWTTVSDTSSTLEFTIGNSFMSRAATTVTTTTLSAGINNSTTSIPLTSATGFICGGNQPYIRVGSGATVEIMGCSSIAGSTITATRGQFGTTAQSHSSGDTLIGLPLAPTGPNIGAQATLTVNVKPRRMQNFRPAAGATIHCSYTPNGGATTNLTPTVDSGGHWTIPNMIVNSSGTTNLLCTP